MLSDEELKEIERRSARYLEHWQPFDSPPDDEWGEASEDVTALLAEVKRLRAQQPTNCTRCKRLLDKCSECDRPEWQSVADGAKPGPEDWYVAACTDRERDFNSNAVTLRTRATSRYPGQSLLDGATHFLVIPPPPIKRETKGPAVWPDGGTFEVSIPATQVSAYSGGPVARVADMTFKLIRTGVECVFVEMNSTQMHDYYAIGGHAWKIGDPIKRES